MVDFLDLLFPSRGISGLDRYSCGLARRFVFLMPRLEKLDPGVQTGQLRDILETSLPGNFNANEPSRVGELGLSLSSLLVGRGLEVGQRLLIVRREKTTEHQPAHEKPLFDRAHI